MVNISYISLLQNIEAFASAHLQIKKFGSDFAEQMPNFATQDEAYPILFVAPTTSVFDANITTFTIDVYCFDIIQKDRNNINTILSDTNQIINDFKKWFTDGEVLGIDVLTSSSAVPINNALLDYVAGWQMTITFEVESYTVCEIPFDGSPVITGLSNEIVYSQYLTCETVTGCTTLQEYVNTEIQDAIVNLPTNDFYVTGGTFSANTLTLERNDGGEVVITGFTSENTFVTGFTNNGNNLFTISNNDGSSYSTLLEELSGITVNGITATETVDFNLTASTTNAVGRLNWNDTDGTLNLGLKGGNVSLQIGQETVLRGVNKSGGDLLESNYQAVYISGATGQRVNLKLAQANNSTAHNTIGIVTENIQNNQEGFVCTNGQVHEINTTGSLQGESWNDGDILYLSTTIPGAITNIRPSAPNHIVRIGYIEYSHPVHGKIFVNISIGNQLGELEDVAINNVVDNQYLSYDAVTQTWINRSFEPDILPLQFVQAATVGILSFSPIYSNGVSGVGATLSASTVGVLRDTSTSGKIDTSYTPVVGDLILVKNQSAQTQNGIYVITSAGTTSSRYLLTRATTADASAELYPLQVNVLQGTVNANQYFTQATPNPTVGASNIIFDPASYQNTTGQIAFVDTATSVALPSNVYANGTTSPSYPGLNATLTATANGALGVINGLTASTTTSTLGTFNRILVKNEANPAYNGDYIVVNAGSASTKWQLRRINYSATNFSRYSRYFMVSNNLSTLAGRLYITTPNATPLANSTVGTAAINIVEYTTNMNVGNTPILNGASNQILFQSTGGTLSESSNFVWDNANKRLGINTNAPAATFDMYQQAGVPVMRIRNTANNNDILRWNENFSITLGDQHTVTTATRSTIIGGQACNIQPSAQYSQIFGGYNNIILNAATNSTIIGGSNNLNAEAYTNTEGQSSYANLYGQKARSIWNFNNLANGKFQISQVSPFRSATLATGGSMVLFLDGSQATKLIIPYVNTNKVIWNVSYRMTAVVDSITGTATGVAVNDTIATQGMLVIKRVGTGAPTILGHSVLHTIGDASMTASGGLTFSIGGSNQIIPTYTAPTFVGGGSLIIRCDVTMDYTETWL